MNYSVNTHNLDEIKNSILLGGPKHLEIIEDYGSYTLRYHEMPELPMISEQSLADPDDIVSVDVHNYYRTNVVLLGQFHGHVYIHESLYNSNYNDVLHDYSELINRIRYDYDACCYKFFNSPRERSSADDNWDDPMTYAPYIPIQYHEFPYISDGEMPWYPPAGWDKGKLKKETKKLQLKLDDKLFEL